jgi:hypothetical protein
MVSQQWMKISAAKPARQQPLCLLLLLLLLLLWVGPHSSTVQATHQLPECRMSLISRWRY